VTILDEGSRTFTYSPKCLVKLSEKVHERANRLTIKRVIAT
jgi:hypothetical protein